LHWLHRLVGGSGDENSPLIRIHEGMGDGSVLETITIHRQPVTMIKVGRTQSRSVCAAL
jgi:hypothetical protein